jgi:hypothetical protein
LALRAVTNLMPDLLAVSPAAAPLGQLAQMRLGIGEI